MQMVKKNQEEAQMSAQDGQNSTNRTTTNNGEKAQHCCAVLDELYNSIASEVNHAKLQKVLLSSSYPSPISLKLQGIQEMLKGDKGRMGIDSINFAIRKLRREETIDRSPTDSESMIRKYYFSTDFARLASIEDDGLLDLETCVHNDFVYHHHNAFGQDPDLSVQEVLFIPVVHHGCWSLYAFNISDKKLSIFDPAPERAFNMSYEMLGAVDPKSETESGVGRLLVATPESEHDNSRLKICKALDFVKDNFNLFKNASGKFSSWRYEFTDLGQFRETSSPPTTPLHICSDEDSGFFVFNFMRRWDGQQFINPGEIPKEAEKLRKGFLEYIVSFNCNEVYEVDDLPGIFGLMEKIKRRAQKVSGRPAWTRCKMDNELLKAVRENNADKFAGLFGPNEKMLRQNLCRGATSDGDGVLHIAARYGDLKLLRAIFKEVHVELNLEAVKNRMLEGNKTNVEDACVVVPTEEEEERQQRLIKLQELLRSRNHKGETCLHEAVRHGDELFALSLILADEKIMKNTIGQLPTKINGPLLVQIVDYEGVSPLYLATTLCRSKIVRIILTYQAYEGTSRQLAKQTEIPALDNQSLLASSVQNRTPPRPLFAATNKTSPQNGTADIPAAPANQIVASFSGPGGKTALHASVVLDEEITKQVLKWMVDVNDAPDLTVMSDSSGNTPLHLVSSVDDGAAIARLLLSVTAKVASGSGTTVASGSGTAGKPTCAALKKDSKGWLPIHVAAANGSLDVIKQLIDKCPECIESRNASGQSFLHVAVEKKRRNVVKYVCSQQSLAGILNLTDRDGNTALHLAVVSGSQFLFCDLMGNPRVHLNSENREGRTPRDVAELSIAPGLHLRMNSRLLIKHHLKLSGAHYGTCRRDVLNGEIEGKLDKDKLSETISKSAALMAVCAFFIVNISVTTFFNAHQLDPNTAAAAVTAPAPSPLGAAEGRSSRVKARIFKALITFDAITFASAILAAFCSTFGGFSIMDRPTRFLYISIAGYSFQFACMGLIAIFILAAYLAFTPVDPRIATVACVLSLATVTPQLMTQAILVLLHAWTISRRWFRNHVFPILRRIYYWVLPIFPKIRSFFKTYLPDKCSFLKTYIPDKCSTCMGAIWTFLIRSLFMPIWTGLKSYLFTPIKDILKFIFKCIVFIFMGMGYFILLLLGLVVVLAIPILVVVFIVVPEP